MPVTLPRLRVTFRNTLAILAGLSILLAACTSDAGPSDDRTGLRLLVAGDQGLSEVSEHDGSRLLVKIDEGAYVLDPAVSRDGKQLAFAIQQPAKISPTGAVDFGSDLYMSKRNGSDVNAVLKHQLVAEFIRTPVWLPDGTLLIAVRSRDATTGAPDVRIESFDPRTLLRARLVQDAVDPALSPDGKSLLFVTLDPETQAEALTIAPLDDLSKRRALAGTTNQLALISSAVWSPDGQRIAFAAVDISQPAVEVTPAPNQLRYAHPFAQDVWLVNLDGTNLHRLTDLADNQPSLDWSADGSTVYALGITGFWRIDARTGAHEPVDLDVPLGQMRLLP